jgi:hypothetical protein
MKEYKPQLRISDGPLSNLCSATALGNTVIGILFEKKGTEVKKALSARIKAIDDKIEQYQTVAVKIEDFIDKKRAVLKDLDLFYQGKCDDRQALIAPFKREVEEIAKKCCNIVFDHDKKVLKDLSKKAVTFEDGFEQFKPNFDELDEFLKKEENTVSEIQGERGYYGPQGVTGIQGTTGMQGLKGEFYSPNLSTDFLEKPDEPIRGIGFGDNIDDITEEENSAMAKMTTLRNLLQKYMNRIESLKKCIKRLNQEKRCLILVLNNVNDERDYKLDLNKLSAFGFEDLE